MLKPENEQLGKEMKTSKWKKVTRTVKQINVFTNVKQKKPLHMETIENKFCSNETKRQLSRGNSMSVFCQAAFYTKPSQQSSSIATLPGSMKHSLPPLTFSASNTTLFDDSSKTTPRRIKRKKSNFPGNSLLHQGSNTAFFGAPSRLTDEERFRLRCKFKGLVRVFLAFKKIWMFHKGRRPISSRYKQLGDTQMVKQPFVCIVRVDEILQTFKGLDSLVRTAEDDSDLLFNVSHYKAKKQSVVSLEVKRILSKHPTMRTPKDIHALIVFMGNYDTLAEYPMLMQRKMAEKAWYEWYDAKRVITREGHVAYSFFYVLSGSAVMTSFDQQSTVSKTVKFISRGDSFGEECLMHGRPRDCTTISKEAIELLVLRDEDFTEIFMAGGVGNKDTFLENLSYMQGWPIELLQTGARGVVFTYFKKGTVIVNDSRANEFIYIVKSGSCGVIKKLKATQLHEINLNLISGRRSPLKESLVKRVSSSEEYSFELARSLVDSKLQAMLDEQVCKKDELAYYDPDIHIPLNGLLEEVKTMKRRKILPPIKAKTASPPIIKITKAAKTEKRQLENIPEEDEDEEALDSEIAEDFSMRSTEEMVRLLEEAMKPKEQMMRQSQDAILKEQNISQAESSEKKCSPDVFITVQHLKAGSHFGLLEAIADLSFKHPSLSLVSNGAECVVIHRKLFLDNAPLKLLDKLREQLFPYPSDERLQQNFEISLYWDNHRQHIVDSQLSELKFKQLLTYT
ncbi:uncharacterized protein [Watersipora subatra]|uniref:uncharacterized protein n=1 Tax=Watersipora subatra TaxID=2589382 RepID=UPI00355AD04D